MSGSPHKGFEDYMLEGPIAALDAIEKATGERQVNVTGYCLGGISALRRGTAWLQAKGDDRIKSATYLTTMVDFCDTGEVSLFIDRGRYRCNLEERINERGFLDGKMVDVTFRTLRANDLVWSFFVNSYLLGREPQAFRHSLLERRLHEHAGRHPYLSSCATCTWRTVYASRAVSPSPVSPSM